MNKSIHKLIDEQIKRWEMGRKEPKPIAQSVRCVTISREAGSQGHAVAVRLAEKIGFDLFHHEIIDAMVEQSKNSRALLETLDEKAMNIVDDVISNFVNERHLWPDEYSKLLMKVLTTIVEHGSAVLLGRGAHCVVGGKNALRVRIVAPEAMRRRKIQETFDLNSDDAKRRMASIDANRAAFVRRYFNCDATDPANYDLLINTGTLSVDRAVQVIQCAIN